MNCFYNPHLKKDEMERSYSSLLEMRYLKIIMMSSVMDVRMIMIYDYHFALDVAAPLLQCHC